MQVNEWFGVDFVPPIYNIIKNEIPAQVFSQEFCELFHPANLLRTKLRRRCFLGDFAIFFSLLL